MGNNLLKYLGGLIVVGASILGVYDFGVYEGLGKSPEYLELKK